MSSKLKIAVIYGGPSPEHEVSIITAVQAMAAMPQEYEIIPLYVTKEGTILTGQQLFSLDSYRNLPLLSKMTKHVILPTSPNTKALSPAKSSFFAKNQSHPFDVLFPCFHGGVGEGGWIQGLAEYYQIPLVGTGLTGAAIGMDKVAMRAAFAGANLPQAKYVWFSRASWQSNAQEVLALLKPLHYPLFVKPSRGGSSIGTSKVKNLPELNTAIDLAAGLDTRIIVEEGIESAREINISVMGNAGHPLEFSVCEEVFHASSDFLNFSDKYLVGNKPSRGMASANRQIPADLPTDTVKTIQNYAATIFQLLDCGGLVRIDFLLKSKVVYVIEVNTIPGSLAFFLWEKSSYTYPQLLSHLIKLALTRHQENQVTVKDFASPILANPELSSKLGAKLKR